jgi:hypothetical protein
MNTSFFSENSKEKMNAHDKMRGENERKQTKKDQKSRMICTKSLLIADAEEKK